jgi:hypothetical protein
VRSRSIVSGIGSHVRGREKKKEGATSKHRRTRLGRVGFVHLDLTFDGGANVDKGLGRARLDGARRGVTDLLCASSVQAWMRTVLTLSGTIMTMV